MTNQELIAYYQALLITQYAALPNAKQTVALFVAQVIANQIIKQVEDGFNIAVTPVGIQADSAIGAQLDILATYRGASRILYGLAPNSYFQMPDATDTDPALGFMDAPDDPATIFWLFLTAQNTQQPIYTMTDQELYRLIQFRTRAQSMFMSVENIDNLMEEFFGDNVAMLDNNNMTMLYVDLNSDTDTLFGILAISQSLPRPAGVKLQTFRADLLTDFFGLQDAETSYDSTFSGFSDALTSLTTGTFISAP